MPKFITTLKKGTLIAMALSLFAVAPPAATFADDSDSCTVPSGSQSGVQSPIGADSGMFTYKCDGPYAGKWISAYFIYDPATGARTPRDAAVYTYNDATGLWDSYTWDYAPAQGGYVKDPVSVTTPPSGAQTVGGPKAQTANPVASNTTPSNDTQGDNHDPSTPGSNLNQNGTSNTNVNNTTGAQMNNGIVSFAGSGNANVTGNTTGGGATSGGADAVANVINMLQSSSNVLSDPNLMSFTANINGDVNGDLLLDPAQLGTMQPANVSTSLDNNVTVNNTLNAAMNNDITLGATTGNADVSTNTKAGDATSGNANAVANIVNTLNSYVTAGKSFIGVININGNLNGDILLPPDFVDTLLASNVPHYDITTNLSNTSNVTTVNNATVNNNVNLASATGKANVADNTQAGSAQSGNALTNLTVFNLTGSNVVASNDMLVFVNVLGKWYGMIMNAPGSTAASLGGGVVNASIDNNANLNNTNNQAINNNIHVNSRSGDANVSDNTQAGNARTGNATSSVNLTNLINDRLTLSGWFGLLFINVFGTWNGSFGVNTSAGDPVATPQSSGNGASGPMFQFSPATANAAAGGAGGFGGSKPFRHPGFESARHGSSTRLTHSQDSFRAPTTGQRQQQQLRPAPTGRCTRPGPFANR
jgi:hypothetical protein